MAPATLNPATLNPAIPFAASGPGAVALDSDAALMARVQAGDLDAFEPLVHRYEKRLFGYFLNRVDDPATAADLAQETFVRVYRAAPRYQDSGRFESWSGGESGEEPAAPPGPAGSARIARRGAGRRAGTCGPQPRGPSGRSRLAGGTPGRPPEGVAPGAAGVSVLLRDVEGWTYREIAEMLGVQEGTVKSRAHRGRQRLKELLAPMFAEALCANVGETISPSPISEGEKDRNR